MRQFFASFMLIACAPLLAQEECPLFNIQELSDAYLNFQVDTIILQPDGSFEVQLSNGTTFTQVQGCTDTSYLEYNASANTDDGSCTTLVVEGCTDPAYDEYNASANIEDGSCTTPVPPGCTDPAYTEYNASANIDDGSCVTLVGCSESDFASMDGYNYNIVQIGDQCWFSENLRTTVYADDSDIPEVTGNVAWSGLSSGARCTYDNDASNVATLQGFAVPVGRLYNWYAVDDSRGLCPSGWHVPTDGEWTELKDYITSQGFDGYEGYALKSTSGWTAYGYGEDDFGFSAHAGGYRYSDNGNFYAAWYSGLWWSSSPSGGNAWERSLSYYNADFTRYDRDPRSGLSVRCLRDAH